MNQCLHCGLPAKKLYCSLSCSNKSRTAKNEANYKLNPKICICCSNPIPYQAHSVNIYCSHSCAATINNKIPKRKKITKEKLDNSLHSQAFERFKLGMVTTRHTIRRCLQETAGNHCAICGQPPEWMNKPLTLIVDHIDGNAGNNKPGNLRLLCPHCNSQTPTFCGRNKGNGRQSRGLPKN